MKGSNVTVSHLWKAHIYVIHTYMCMSQIDQRKYVCMNIFIKVGDYAEQLTSAFEGYDPRRYRRVRMYVCMYCCIVHAIKYSSL